MLSFLSNTRVYLAVGQTDLRKPFDLLAANARLKELVASSSKSAPKLASWMEENLPQGFALPPAHQIRLRTSNALERVNSEIDRRIHVASIFPHELSLLRLVSANPLRNYRRVANRKTLPQYAITCSVPNFISTI